MAKDKLPSATQFISRVHAAARIDVDPQTIDNMIKDGRLRAYRLGKRKILIKAEELLRLVEAGEIQ
jgi:excisionase family DNA binding protein